MVALAERADLQRSTASFDTDTSATPEQPKITNANPPRIAAMDFVSESLKVRAACACAGLTGMRRVQRQFWAPALRRAQPNSSSTRTRAPANLTRSPFRACLSRRR